MRTQRFITIVCLLLWTVAHLHAYEKRDLLQKEVDFEKVKSALIMEQKWVPYPDYSDRAGWDKLLGDYKEKYIRKGESYLDYEWKVVKATDYLAVSYTHLTRLIGRTLYVYTGCKTCQCMGYVGKRAAFCQPVSYTNLKEP